MPEQIYTNNHVPVWHLGPAQSVPEQAWRSFATGPVRDSVLEPASARHLAHAVLQQPCQCREVYVAHVSDHAESLSAVESFFSGRSMRALSYESFGHRDFNNMRRDLRRRHGWCHGIWFKCYLCGNAAGLWLVYPKEIVTAGPQELS